MEDQKIEKEDEEPIFSSDDEKEVSEIKVRSKSHKINYKLFQKEGNNINDDTQSNRKTNSRNNSEIDKSEFDEKTHLISVFQNLKKVLDDDKQKNIEKIYESLYLKNEDVKKNHLRENIDKHLFRFIFFIEGPFYGIIFLNGIFQMKSLMNALFEIIKDSSINYFNVDFVQIVILPLMMVKPVYMIFIITFIIIQRMKTLILI